MIVYHRYCGHDVASAMHTSFLNSFEKHCTIVPPPNAQHCKLQVAKAINVTANYNITVHQFSMSTSYSIISISWPLHLLARKHPSVQPTSLEANFKKTSGYNKLYSCGNSFLSIHATLSSIRYSMYLIMTIVRAPTIHDFACYVFHAGQANWTLWYPKCTCAYSLYNCDLRK